MSSVSTRDSGAGGDAMPQEHDAHLVHEHPYRTDQEHSVQHSDIQFRLQGSEDAAAADPPTDPNDVINLLNTTDGELSGLSHLDAPISESVYMICGVLIAMVLVGLIIVLLAVTISKLRKREESNHNPGPNRLVLPQDGAKVLNGQSNNLVNGVGPLAPPLEGGPVATPTLAPLPAAPAPPAPASPGTPTPDDTSASEEEEYEEVIDGKDAPLEFVLWSHPTSPSNCGTQLSLYSGDQDTLVHTLPYEEPGDCKPGFRKNLRGKWKRLVKKKPTSPDVFAIPPELRDQLKQIYVY